MPSPCPTSRYTTLSVLKKGYKIRTVNKESKRYNFLHLNTDIAIMPSSKNIINKNLPQLRPSKYNIVIRQILCNNTQKIIES